MSAPFNLHHSAPRHNGRRPEGQRATARRLRRVDGMGVREIAARIGVPRATVGDWVKDIPASGTCRLCGSPFESPNSRREFCSDQHAYKWRDIYGSRAA